mgnify:CR=1 FL=1
MAKRRLKSKNQNNQNKIREKNNADKLFLLHIKKSLYVIIIWALSIIIHNLVYKFSGIDEPFFTILAIYIIPIYLLISVIYTLIRHLSWDKNLKE